jgi:XTP/dITP diphosphohydrolase
VSVRDKEPARNPNRAPAPIRILLASSNPGKLREYRGMVEPPALNPGASENAAVQLLPVPHFADIPPFDESAPTFAENALGKALHYSRFSTANSPGLVLADDSGLVVPALDGAPGVFSHRYAGPNTTDEDRYRKLLREMDGKEGDARRAHFVCVTAVAQQGRAIAVVSALARGIITHEPRGSAGFGYDPVFCFEELGRTYAETTREEKNLYSHRGKAFRKLLALLRDSDCISP